MSQPPGRVTPALSSWVASGENSEAATVSWPEGNLKPSMRFSVGVGAEAVVPAESGESGESVEASGFHGQRLAAFPATLRALAPRNWPVAEVARAVALAVARVALVTLVVTDRVTEPAPCATMRLVLQLDSGRASAVASTAADAGRGDMLGERWRGKGRAANVIFPGGRRVLRGGWGDVKNPFPAGGCAA